MKIDEKLQKKFEDLIALGSRLRHTGQGEIDDCLAGEWSASGRSLLAGVFGRDSEHYDRFAEYTKQHISSYHADLGHGVVLAAQRDFLANGLLKVRQLVEAEIFDDFVEQAEHLLSNGYFQAAAVVAGCVLEDALRKLCVKHGSTLPENPKLDTMNSDLAKNGVYDKLVQKRVTAESDLRNKAAHGKWDQFKREDVEAMISWVRRFLSDYCT